MLFPYTVRTTLYTEHACVFHGTLQHRRVCVCVYVRAYVCVCVRVLICVCVCVYVRSI